MGTVDTRVQLPSTEFFFLCMGKVRRALRTWLSLVNAPLVDPLPESGCVIESDTLIASTNYKPVLVRDILDVADNGRADIVSLWGFSVQFQSSHSFRYIKCIFRLPEIEAIQRHRHDS